MPVSIRLLHTLLEAQRFILLCAISLSIAIRKLLILIHTLSITQSFSHYFSRLSAPSFLLDKCRLNSSLTRL